METLIYKDAHRSDLSKIVAIYNSTVASRMVTADTSKVTVESKANWFEAHNASQRPLWMIENNSGETVGWVSFQSFYGRPAYNATVEISIYIDEQFRGRGFGKSILKYCIEQCKNLKIETLLAFIFSHNEPSIKLFERFGFEHWGLLPDIARMDEENYSLRILGKKV
ncbi:MAG: N-acetyltransferase [Porphyromonadaceae bacterium CG2_30_38_12]|nr:MAG: N-acetyltransferase [Porphyromonadaceae bacterium CG2_30_38_12]